MDILQSILPFVGVLIGLVIIHEFGHFIVAKISGVRVEEFGIGLPPRICGKRFGETLYSINWLPLGGFVRLTGEESSRVYVSQVDKYGAANKAGIQSGDIITKVGDQPVHTKEQLEAHLTAAKSDPYIKINIERTQHMSRGSKLISKEIIINSALDQGSSKRKPFTEISQESENYSETIDRIVGIQVRPDERSLASKSRPTRILVMAAGVVMNMLLPVILFAAAAMIPQDTAVGPALITSVAKGAPAERAGLMENDQFVTINGVQVRNASDVSREIQLKIGSDINVVVERSSSRSMTSPSEINGKELFTTTVRARLAPKPLNHTVEPGQSTHDVAEILGVSASHVLASIDRGDRIALVAGTTLNLPDGITYTVKSGDTAISVGRNLGYRTAEILKAADIDLLHIKPGTEIVIPQGATGITIVDGSSKTMATADGFFSAWKTGAQQTLDTINLLRNRIRSWIAGGESLELSGPVGIAQTTGEIIEKAGWLKLIELAALLSINLAIINILPLPMLDGGRIMFVLLEILRRGKRIAPEKEGLVHFAGFVLLMLLVLVITYFDITRVISGESALGPG